MKKTASALLFVILVFSAAIPAFAQKARSIKVPAVKGDFVQFERMEALSQGQGVYIRWQMVSETNNLGFYVYRNGEQGPVLVNPLMIPGSATGSAKFTSGREYDTVDADGTVNSTYFIKSQALDGRVANTNTFGVKYSLDTEMIAGRPLPLPGNVWRNNSRVERHNPVVSSELQAIIEANMLPADLASHLSVVSKPGAKIGVRKDGFYRVSRAQLEGAGFDVNSPSTHWRLYMEGNEQAIIVGAGDEYIEFFGKGIDTVESDTRYYYLITGPFEGKRIQNKILRPIGGNVVSNNYRVTNENKERLFYNNVLKNGEAENYFGRLVTEVPPAPSQIINFTLTGIETAVATAVISIRLQGLPGGAIHTVRAVLNGNEIGNISGVGGASYSGDIVVPTAFLVEGTNLLSLNELVSGSASYFDTVSVSFTRKYRAEQNKISYPTPGYRRIDLSGFATPNVRVFDTTYDGTPALITGLTAVQNGATFNVGIPSARPMMMYALEDTALLTSPSVIANTPSTLRSDVSLANFLVISPAAPDFMAAGEDWAAYRRTQGGGNFSAKVVSIEDVFDEYNYGVLSASAINSFLSDIDVRWDTQYVLLLGDSSYDSRNYEGLGYFNIMPTRMLNLIYDESNSDDAMADFDADGLPEIAIGRISARSGFAVSTALAKTQSFETRAGLSLNRGALFASDFPSGFDFQAMNQLLSFELPPTMPRTFVYRGDPDSQNTLIAAMNTGMFVVNYAGHGTTGSWGSTSFFSSNNVPQLTNQDRQSVFVMLTCLNGYFIRPRDSDACLAERLVRHGGGGAVASWASSTETTPDFQLQMGTRFFSHIGSSEIVRLGDMIKDAKTVLPGSSDLRFSWVLLGDPALKMVNPSDTRK